MMRRIARGVIRGVEGALPPVAAAQSARLRQAAARALRDRLRGREELPAMDRFGLADHDVFAGYYDICPEAPSAQHVLAHAVRRRGRADLCDILLFDTADPNRPPEVLTQTRLWSWQLGARARWLGEAVLLNAESAAAAPGALLIDPGTGTELARYDAALFDVAPDGRFALSLDFARLAWARPGYGYPVLSDPERHIALPTHGISRIELESGARSEILPLPDIAAFEPRADFADAKHYLNHISINPDGTRFFFLHFWRGAGTGRWQARALTASCDGGGLHLLEDRPIPSHYAWVSARDISMFHEGPDGRGEFRLYTDLSDAVRPLAPHLPERDGHQSFTADGRTMLVDSYPDPVTGEQSLWLFGLSGGGSRIGRFVSTPPPDEAERCDLHPRFTRDERGIWVDSTLDGGRALYRVRLPEGASVPA